MKKKLILIITLMTLFHWLMILWWYIFKNITVKSNYTTDNKEFKKCEYSKSKIFRYGII